MPTLTPSVLSRGPGTGQRGSIFVRFGGHQNFRLTIDGKTCRRARDAARKAAHIISAWSLGEKLTLGVCMVEEKGNELSAVPELPDLLGTTLKGAVVTADALNT